MTMNRILSFLSAEWILKHRANGGDAVLLRTLFISSWLYLLAIAIRSYSEPGALLSFSIPEFKQQIGETLPWLGAILGATYAALYSRFSSQWAYLANLYNEQMAYSCSLPEGELYYENFTAWQAAFIEDAMLTHLATKKGFNVAIYEMLQEEDIVKTLTQSVEPYKVFKLQSDLERILRNSPMIISKRAQHSRTPTKKPRTFRMKMGVKYFIETMGDRTTVGYILDNHVYFMSGAWAESGEVVDNTITDSDGRTSKIIGNKIIRHDGQEFVLIPEYEME